MDYKILALDLDGTLLNSTHEITCNTLQVIKTLRSLGMCIVITTGRSYNACTYYSKLIDADYTIACNGAFTYDNKKNTIYNKIPLDKKLSQSVLEMLFKGKDKLKIQWDSISTYYSNNITPFESNYIENYKRDFPDEIFNHRIINKYNKNHKGFNEEIYQIFFHPTSRSREEYFDVLQELKTFQNINIVDFKNECTDINNICATKGNGLKTLANSLNVPSEKIIAFGDGNNDISMFKYAGLAVAMENACAEIKELSNMITSHHDKEGVANALQSIFKLNPSNINT
ncbi:Cof-type HAD-IIB family hydrolase [Alkalibaculum sp. M08DMB]|uniref:Cof-type HAD-IIB family hydrolase n=1 Tax=Alkalibaculum sporogenes TaxID=2655001 RepID=A0A6A7K5L6_9FIRM|nr:HAD family hydrolase [Alkalibaculum sporogenes]MPW24708.1 Cof-type HAD-IIB family hydrolase [Alkalibaculum sporogenes]